MKMLVRALLVRCAFEGSFEAVLCHVVYGGPHKHTKHAFVRNLYTMFLRGASRVSQKGVYSGFVFVWRTVKVCMAFSCPLLWGFVVAVGKYPV